MTTGMQEDPIHQDTVFRNRKQRSTKMTNHRVQKSGEN